MTEKELRSQVVAVAQGWLGRRMSDGSHREIVDVYNSHQPLARGYKVSYTDPWCAVFVSAVAIQAGLTSIMPTECSCSALIKRYEELGRWAENDSRVPQPGDLMMYDWQDKGAGDDAGAPDHVGIVASVSGDVITVLEGNKGGAVDYRTMTVNGRYIRGYCCPDYASAATPAEPGATEAAPEAWYKGSLDWAVAQGVSDGARPEDACTRAEVWEMLRRYAEGRA